jgi:hypothetical protein
MWVCLTGTAPRVERIVHSSLPRYVLLPHWRARSSSHSIESLTQSYVVCMQSAFVGSLDDFAVNGNLPQAAERAFLDCQPPASPHRILSRLGATRSR